MSTVAAKTLLLYPQNMAGGITERPMMAYVADPESQTLRYFSDGASIEEILADRRYLISTPPTVDTTDVDRMLAYGVSNQIQPTVVTEHPDLRSAMEYAVQKLNENVEKAAE